MTKHPNFGRSPSIMEPVDETPSLLTEALFDAMNSADTSTVPEPSRHAPHPQPRTVPSTIYNPHYSPVSQPVQPPPVRPATADAQQTRPLQLPPRQQQHQSPPQQQYDQSRPHTQSVSRPHEVRPLTQLNHSRPPRAEPNKQQQQSPPPANPNFFANHSANTSGRNSNGNVERGMPLGYPQPIIQPIIATGTINRSPSSATASLQPRATPASSASHSTHADSLFDGIVSSIAAASLSPPAVARPTTISQPSAPNRCPPPLDDRYPRPTPNNTSDPDQMSSINMHYERSFALLNANEEMTIHTADMFIKKLGCAADAKLKVVSIFGNTGDGKSHTMNHSLFGGQEIFRESAAQESCTMGVWAAHQAELGVLCLDTEGLLGDTETSNLRTRLLLKVLAISDVIVFRTRAERLHSDMFQFLGTASRAYSLHFSAALQAMGLPGPAQTLGPAVIVFHETRNTQVVEPTHESSAEDRLRERFTSMQLNLEAFSSLKYIGLQTKTPPTNYDKILTALHAEICNTTVRSPRTPAVIFKALQALNTKFSGQLTERVMNPFPEQYFTCGEQCQSCSERCEISMGHLAEGRAHSCGKPCRYQHQFENKEELCKRCYENGRREIVSMTMLSENDSSWMGIARYAIYGRVIVCRNCGEIYRSHQNWWYNKNPEEEAVRSEIRHVWSTDSVAIEGPIYSAQKVLDSVSYLTDAVSSLSVPPTKLLTNWVSDSVRPSYWRPDSEIRVCHNCRLSFEKNVHLRKHHCRACGLGFCTACSLHKRPVPGRGWKEPVRVCDGCKEILFKDPHAVPEPQLISHPAQPQSTPPPLPPPVQPQPPQQSTTVPPPTKPAPTTTRAGLAVANGEGAAGGQQPPVSEEQDVMPRKYGEVLMSALSSISGVMAYSKDLIKDSARPSYWVPDSESPNCALCKLPFGTAEDLTAAASPNHRNQPGVICDRSRHHCRACGLAVCDPCSLARMAVPDRGWTADVRVCDSCVRRPRANGAYL